MRITLLAAGVALALALPLSGCDSIEVAGDRPGDEGGETFVRVNPRQSYVLTSNNDLDDLDAPAVRLADFGYITGGPICFRAEGDFFLSPNYRASQRGGPLVTAVFSRTDELRNGTFRDRVTGAIDAGTDVVTDPTNRDALATDIGQDFDATDVCLTVPEGARFVFFGAYDTYYTDNADLNGAQFGVLLTSRR